MMYYGNCPLCGAAAHGSIPCQYGRQQYSYPIYVFYPQHYSNYPVGWRCPVCGTGCAPTLATHCDQPAPVAAPVSVPQE